MKNFLICVFVSVTTCLFGIGFYANSSDAIAKSEVLNLTNKFHEAQITKDVAKLKQILADDIQISHNRQISNGTKEQIVSNVEEAEVESISPHFVFTNVTDGKVKVFFQMEMKFHSDGEFPSIHYGKYEYIYEKQQNEWKLVSISLKN